MRAAVLGTSLILSLASPLTSHAQTPPDPNNWRYSLSIHDIARADDDTKLTQLLNDSPDRVLQRLPSNGATAAHVAAEAGSLKALGALAKAGADLNALDSQGRTPLSIAVGTNYAATVKTLLQLGADPNKEGADTADRNGQFTQRADPELPLAIAARRGHLEILKTLLAAKADINKRGTNESTPLLAAAAAGNWDAAMLLIENGAAVNVADRSGMTPLLYAAAASNEKLVTFLLSKNADARAVDRQGRNVLALTQSPALWKMLVEKGANVNVVVGGSTPLQYFIDQGNLDLVKVWLDFRPDPFITDRQGRTAKELARIAADRGYSPARQEIARLVEAYQKKFAAEELAREAGEPQASTPPSRP